MLTVLDAVQKSTEYLEKKGIESARLNAELLLAEILNCKRLDLYLRFEKPLSDEETNKYREWIARRGKYEPLQYIIGHVEFYALKINVNSSVLIPRQETEILLETIIEQIKNRNGLKILDVGTGSGIIPVVLAKHLIDAQIISIDVSSDAINVAQNNALMNEVESKINFLHRDIFEADFEPDMFDIIVSNPPYVSNEEYISLQKEITEFEPRIALTDEGDGYKYYKFITEKAKLWLKENGKLYFEVGKDQSDKVIEIMNSNEFRNIAAIKDYLNIERVIKGEK